MGCFHIVPHFGMTRMQPERGVRAWLKRIVPIRLIDIDRPDFNAVIRRVGTQSPPDDYWTALLTPSGLAAWSHIAGVVTGTLTP